MFTRLLLAIDDSEGSEVATVFTAAYAQPSGASVHVFHVNEYLVGGHGLTLLREAEAAALVSGALEQLRTAGVDVSASVALASYRDVAARIAGAAHEREVDAIVLGSERQRRFGRLFSGRVRERTTGLTSLPVLIAPSPLNVSGRSGLTVEELMELHVARELMVPSP
jgi:nucleotide-binding universal stress UspA family protein